MAWTQSDVEAQEQKIRQYRRSVSSNGRSVANAELQDELRLLAEMKASVAASTTSGGGRTTRAVFDRE